MRIFIILLGASFLLAACSGSGGGSQEASLFQGTWLEKEIVDVRKSSDDAKICEFIEMSNGAKELSIDGVEIDSNGHVKDFQLNSTAAFPVWKVRSDGSVYDDYIMQNKDTIDGAENLVGHKMRYIDESTIANVWTIKPKGSENIESEVIFVKVSPEEVAKIKSNVEKCPTP